MKDWPKPRHDCGWGNKFESYRRSTRYRTVPECTQRDPQTSLTQAKQLLPKSATRAEAGGSNSPPTCDEQRCAMAKVAVVVAAVCAYRPLRCAQYRNTRNDVRLMHKPPTTNHKQEPNELQPEQPQRKTLRKNHVAINNYHAKLKFGRD